MEILGRSPVKTINVLRPFWEEFDRVMKALGHGDAAIVGSYACRFIAGTDVYSLHAYRLAIDVDPALNSQQGSGAQMDWTKCKVTREQCDAVEAIRTRSGAQVFRAGWRFNNPDPMHFQIACTQADIASGLGRNEDDMRNVKIGDENPYAESLYWMVYLIETGFHPIDGNKQSWELLEPHFGAGTKARVATPDLFARIAGHLELNATTRATMVEEGIWPEGHWVNELRRQAYGKEPT